MAKLSPRAQELLAFAIYVKENVLIPVLENTRQEVEARNQASERESALASEQLVLLAKVVAVMVFLVLGAAVTMLALGKTTEGMWLFTLIAGSAGVGGVTYGIVQKNRD